MGAKVKKFVEPTNNHRRHATYTLKSVRCPNASIVATAGQVAKPGMMVRYHYTLNDDSKSHAWGRVISRVDAPFVKGSEPRFDCPEVDGWLAVLELSWCGRVGFIRWIDPNDVDDVYEAPQRFPAWFFQAEMPSIPEVLAMDRNGSLSESYVDKWIAEHQKQGDE